MKIKCCFNKLSDIKNKNVRKWLQSTGYLSYEDENEPIERFVLGKEYCVYGIGFATNSAPMYYICESDNDECPIPMYSGFYKITDPKLSKYWQLGIISYDDGSHCSEIVFKEWAEEPMFYEKLVDGYECEESIFKKYKKLIDREYEASNTNPIGIKMWRFVDGDIPASDFEDWIYSCKDLEKLMPGDLYMQLISFDYKNIDKYSLAKLKDRLVSWLKKI